MSGRTAARPQYQEKVVGDLIPRRRLGHADQLDLNTNQMLRSLASTLSYLSIPEQLG